MEAGVSLSSPPSLTDKDFVLSRHLDDVGVILLVKSINVKNYPRLNFGLFNFIPIDYFTRDLKISVNVALGSSFAIGIVVSVCGGFVAMRYVLRGVEELSEKLYRDPWAFTEHEVEEKKRKNQPRNCQNEY